MSPPPAPEARQGPHPLATHVMVIAVLDFIYAGLAVIGGLFVLFVFGVGAMGANEGEKAGAPGWVSEMVGALGFLIFIAVVAFALLYFFAGMMLMKRKRVGKVLGIIAAVVQLFGFPIGTAIGIYALIMLNNQQLDDYWVD